MFFYVMRHLSIIYMALNLCDASFKHHIEKVVLLNMTAVRCSNCNSLSRLRLNRRGLGTLN